LQLLKSSLNVWSAKAMIFFCGNQSIKKLKQSENESGAAQKNRREGLSFNLAQHEIGGVLWGKFDFNLHFENVWGTMSFLVHTIERPKKACTFADNGLARNMLSTVRNL